jgi:hypothetical protein
LVREAQNRNLKVCPPGNLLPFNGDVLPLTKSECDDLPLPLFLEPAFFSYLYEKVEKKSIKKKKGAFYTPPLLAKDLAVKLFNHFYSQNSQLPRHILDPAAGAGDLLIACYNEYRNRGVSHGKILNRCLYGYDIDPIAVFITRYALFYLDPKSDIIPKNIIHCDTLNHDQPNRYDCIISNPPWTTRLKKDQKNNLKKYQTAYGEFCLSSVFVEKSLSLMNEKSISAFLLPESLSKISNHLPLRYFLKTNCKLLEFNSLGDPFQNVFAPCANLFFKLKHKTITPEKTRTQIIVNGNTIPYHKFFIGKNYIFNVNYNKTKEALFDKIEKNSTNLEKLGSHFFLGIVTGNNQYFLKEVPPDYEHEPILLSRDVKAFIISPAQYYIHFDKNSFQQVCPKSNFRKPKLVYKFISKKLVFAVERAGQYMLNNLNGIYLDNNEISLEYLAGILNSNLLNDYYQYKFRALRVLKGNLNKLPIRIPGKTKRREIEKLATKLAQPGLCQLEKVRTLSNLNYNIISIYEAS